MLVYQIAVAGVNSSSNIAAVDLSHVWQRVLPGDIVTGAVIISGTNSINTPGQDVSTGFFDHIVAGVGVQPYNYGPSNLFLL